MRVSKKDLLNMVNRLNAVHGFENVEYNTVGSYKLYNDGVGYAIHKVENAGGGVSVVAHCYGMTAKECYYLLCGLLAND